MARGKSNIGPDDGGFEYLIEQVEAVPGIQASRIEWGKAVEGTARELLAEPDDKERKGESDASDAMALLKGELKPGEWVSADVASKPLKDAGFSKKQIWTASKRLHIRRKKGGMDEGWLWQYPLYPGSAFTMETGRREGSGREDSIEDSEGSNVLNGESSESSGDMESPITTDSEDF